MADPSNVLEVPPPAGDDVCSKCGAPKNNSKVGWCLKCGYYPRLGTHVELDPWDKEPEPNAAPEAAKPRANPLKKVPAWCWKLAVALAAVAGVSIAGRLATPEDSAARTIWALSLMATGAITFICAHLASYVYAIMENDRFNLVDLFVKPLAIWMKTFADLPTTLARVTAGSCGLAAVLLANTVVGGIPYYLLWDWGIKERPKTNLVQAIASAAKNSQGGADNLEDAVSDFTGKAAVKDEEDKKEKVIERRMKADCVVAGYIPGENNDFSALVMVAEVEGRLRCVGLVREGIPPEVRAELNQSLREIERAKPFVPCDAAGATWVEPRLTCRVNFQSWTSNKRMVKPLFFQMLAEIDPS